MKKNTAINGAWQKIRRYKLYVIYSNLLLLPWFAIGLSISTSELFVGLWFTLFIAIFKVPLFFLVPRLKCPVCQKPFVGTAQSLAFKKACKSCGARVGAESTDALAKMR